MSAASGQAAAGALNLLKCGFEDSDAVGILVEAADAISQRGTLRDQPDGERSMARTVAAFNALTGQSLSEADGWTFMIVLKAARAQAGRPHRDDYVDLAGYAALAGECIAQAVQS